MEPPANTRRRVVVFALSACKRRALMVQGADGLWHLPNSHLHWPVGARAREPQHVAAVLLHRATLGILGDVTDVRAMLGGERACRSRLPSGGFVYALHSDAIAAHVEAAVDAAARARRFLHLDEGEYTPVQMVSLDGARGPRARARFGGDTVEVVGCAALPIVAPTIVTEEPSDADASVTLSGGSCMHADADMR